MKYKGGNPTQITEFLRSKSSSYNSNNENANEKVNNKITTLLETDNPSPIIEKIKTLRYIDKILNSMYVREHDDKIDKVVIELNKRRSIVKQLLQEKVKQEEIASYIEKLKEYKTKLKRLETKLNKLLANNPLNKLLANNPLNTQIQEYVEETSKMINDVRTIISNSLNNKVDDLQYEIYHIKLHIERLELFIKRMKMRVCSRILTPKQVGPICWFMATFVAMFYSQRSRKILLGASKGWKQDKLFTLLKEVLEDKYMISDKGKEDDYKKFSDDTFGNILKLLFEKDANSFPYNPELRVGFNSNVYIGKLYDLLGVDFKMYDYDNSSMLAYSLYNKEYDIYKYTYSFEYGMYIEKYHYENNHIQYTYKKDTSTPTILIIRVCRKDDVSLKRYTSAIFKNFIIQDEKIKNELTSMRDNITYNDRTYVLDSVILTSLTSLSISRHAIAGITCKGIKYIYNGWMRINMDPAMARQEITRNIPCELMRHDWNVKGEDFCLNTKTCMPDVLKERKLNESRQCFNFSEGDKLLIYVLKDKHLEKLRKADVIKATIRRRSV